MAEATQDITPVNSLDFTRVKFVLTLFQYGFGQFKKEDNMRINPLLVNKPGMPINPLLAKKIGVKEAILLKQIHRLMVKAPQQNIREGRKWVFKTYEEWKRELPFVGSLVTIRRLIRRLEKLGLLISSNRFNSHLTDRTKSYSVDYEKLNTLGA